MTKPSRRQFLQAAACAALAAGCDVPNPVAPDPLPKYDATVAITRAYNFDDSQAALEEAFELVGGVRSMVYRKRVTVKVNLTGYSASILGLPAAHTYATHGSSIHALVGLLARNGASKIRIVEACAPDSLEVFAQSFGWDTNAIRAAGPVEFENTRNLGLADEYARLDVNGKIFDHFLVNHSYADTDVYVSLSKMKNHSTAGVTLGLKNNFGITPNALYATDAPSENAVSNKLGMHERNTGPNILPGATRAFEDADRYFRVPHIVAELAAARPIHLSIIEGISTMSGGEGPWIGGGLSLVKPGIMIVGKDPVATDAVAIRAMGYSDPNLDTLPPFHFCFNYLKIAAEDYKLGCADLDRIEVKGTSLEQLLTEGNVFAWL